MDLPKETLVFMNDFLNNVKKNSDHDRELERDIIDIGCNFTQLASHYCNSFAESMAIEEQWRYQTGESGEKLRINDVITGELFDFFNGLSSDNSFYQCEFEETTEVDSEDIKKWKMFLVFIAPMLKSSHYMMLLIKACWEHGQKTGKPFLPPEFNGR